MAEDHREPPERSASLPRRVPGANGRTPAQVRRGFLPVHLSEPADVAAAQNPPADAAAEPSQPATSAPGQSAVASPPGQAHASPSPTAMASSAARLLRAAAASNQAALVAAAAQELEAQTQRRVVPLQQPGSAAAQAPAPAVTPVPAAARPATLAPAVPFPAIPHSAARRTRSARRWQLTGLLAAIAIVACSVAIALSIRHSPPARAHQNESGSQEIRAARAIRAHAAAWLASQVGYNIEIACDSAMCSDLAQHGFPPGNLNVLQPTAPDPYGSELVIATASLRSQFGTKLATVYAPEVIASFGTGANRIDIRLVAKHGPAAFGRALRADLLARKTSGAELLRNPKIVASAAARAQLAAGQVDLRLLTTLAFLAGQQRVDIVNFGSIAPGASPGVPLRFADLAETDPATRMTAAAYSRALLALVRAQQPPYVPLSVGPVRLTTGQTVLRIEFAAPSPLGLLSS